MYEGGRLIYKSLNHVRVDKIDKAEQTIKLNKIRS